jgi:hypothetical protein
VEFTKDTSRLFGGFPRRRPSRSFQPTSTVLGGEAGGFPRGWTHVAVDEDVTERIRAVATLVDPIDFGTIRRIARLKARRTKSFDDAFGERLTQAMVLALEQRRDIAEEGTS